MIDGADNDDEQFLVDYLNNRGVKQLDYLILTHSNADHCAVLDCPINEFDSIKQNLKNQKDKKTLFNTVVQDLESRLNDILE